MKKLAEKLEALLELGGMKKDIVCLILSGGGGALQPGQIPAVSLRHCLDCHCAVRLAHCAGSDNRIGDIL